MELFQQGGNVKAVDEQCCAANAIRVREKVEELEATRVGLVIRRINM
jgi:hypothetical protein